MTPESFIRLARSVYRVYTCDLLDSQILEFLRDAQGCHNCAVRLLEDMCITADISRMH